VPDILLSVIVPVYRVEAYLAECLDSILDDLRGDIEVIAVDDASPDGCAVLLDAYRDSRLRVLRLPGNVGTGPARNAGLDLARGRYVWFVDSADRLPPGAVGTVRYALSAEPEVLLIEYDRVGATDGWWPDPARAVPRDIFGSTTVARRPGLLRAHLTAGNTVVRRSLLVETGLSFPPGRYADLPYGYPLLLASRRTQVLNRVCYHYRSRPGTAVTRTASERQFEVFTQYDRLFARLRPDDEAYRPILCELMVTRLLGLLGSPGRVAASHRRAFFQEIAAAARRHAPAGGYPVPPGVSGLRHRLVQRDAYALFASTARLGSRRPS
jgi:glycosyltransferase involved in cell wall biosynthesis